MRLFIGIPAPKDVAFERYYSSLKKLGKAVKPIPVQNLHITVKFIGETTIDPESILETMKESLKGIERFVMVPDSTGAFPRWSRPSVIWIGFEDKGKGAEIAGLIDSALKERWNFPKEARDFRSHLTLARIKAGIDIDHMKQISSETLESLKANGYEIPVYRLILYRSTLKPAGPEYEELGSTNLEG